jgi:hypothetical protein
VSLFIISQRDPLLSLLRYKLFRGLQRGSAFFSRCRAAISFAIGFSMAPAQYDELMTTIQHMRDTADALSRSMGLFAASEKNPAAHATFMRLHVALNDCALGLKHALDTAPTRQK